MIKKQKCEYGCGQDATHYFKYSKKWCCEKYTSKCPAMRKINSSSHKLRNISTPIKTNKLCEYGCNKKAKYILNNSEKLCCSSAPQLCSNIRKKNGYTNRVTIKKLQKKYTFFCKIEELKENNEGILEVQCRYCKKWFVPSFETLRSRITHLEHNDGNDGSYFYCSQNCKNKCSCYNVKYINSYTDSYSDFYSSKKYSEWRKDIFKNQLEEWGINECEICGNTKIEQLVAHHEYPLSTHPESALDRNNGIILCGGNSANKCHSKIHKGDCSSYYLNKHVKKGKLKNVKY